MNQVFFNWIEALDAEAGVRSFRVVLPERGSSLT
jgi:hypothetical protein